MKYKQKNNDNRDKFSWDIIFYIATIAVMTIVLLKRCQYGFGNMDESFYLTIPYRLSQGDGLLDTEWHLSQLAGVLLLPAMKIFLALNDGTEGIVLVFRYLFVVVQVVMAVIIFSCMRKYSKTGAFASSVLMAAYAPFGIPALSYNSMGIITLTLATMFLFSSDNRAVQCISGILYSAAVLCCPYLAVLIVIYYFVFLFSFRKENEILSELAEKKKIQMFTVGVLISAAIFLVFLLCRSSIPKIIKSIPFILSDPEHQANIGEKCIELIYSIVFSCGHPWIFPCFALLFVIGFFVKDEHARHVVAILAIALSGVLSLAFLFNNRYINFFMFPLNLAAPVCVVCIKNKKLWKVLWGMWLPGIVYAVCIHFSSNQAFYAISSASAVSLTGSMVIAVETICDIRRKAKHRTMKILVVVVLSFAVITQGTGEIYSRITDVFQDLPVDKQTISMEIGPEKGIFTTQEVRDYYYDSLDNLELIDEETEKILFLSFNMWKYFCGDWEMCTYSAWLAGATSTVIERLNAYYEINREKIPDCIYIEKYYLKFADEFLIKYGFIEAGYTPSGDLILIR